MDTGSVTIVEPCVRRILDNRQQDLVESRADVLEGSNAASVAPRPSMTSVGIRCGSLSGRESISISTFLTRTMNLRLLTLDGIANTIKQIDKPPMPGCVECRLLNSMAPAIVLERRNLHSPAALVGYQHLGSGT